MDINTASLLVAAFAVGVVVTALFIGALARKKVISVQPTDKQYEQKNGRQYFEVHLLLNSRGKLEGAYEQLHVAELAVAALIGNKYRMVAAPDLTAVPSLLEYTSSSSYYTRRYVDVSSYYTRRYVDVCTRRTVMPAFCTIITVRVRAKAT